MAVIRGRDKAVPDFDATGYRTHETVQVEDVYELVLRKKIVKASGASKKVLPYGAPSHSRLGKSWFAVVTEAPKEYEVRVSPRTGHYVALKGTVVGGEPLAPFPGEKVKGAAGGPKVPPPSSVASGRGKRTADRRFGRRFRQLIEDTLAAAKPVAVLDVSVEQALTLDLSPKARRVLEEVAGHQSAPVAQRIVELAVALDDALREKDPTGAILDSVDVDDLAERVADQVDTAPLWSEHLGPVYSAKSVQDLLGISKQAVHQRRGLLRLVTGDGTVIFPAFQFEGTHQVPDVASIVKVIGNAVSPWTLASWFVSDNDDLGGEKPIEAIRGGRAGEALDAAHGWRGRLAA